MMDVLKITHITKRFGDTHALRSVSFDVNLGEIVALLGPSGCGKSTLLAIIAGLESPDQGIVSWGGVSLANTPTHRRQFGLMFQDFALFPHKNVYENIAFGLRMARLPEASIQARVQETLELVGLPSFAQRDTNTMSGGEAQRVALARSLAPNPRLLMLDEPLGSLDRNLRERLVYELRNILKDSQQTAIYVTHDQEEAFVIADRIVVLNAGQVEQIGAPQAIYCQPESAFVANFIGLDNLMAGEIRKELAETVVDTPIGVFPCQDEADRDVTVLLRPDAVQIGDHKDCRMTGVVKEASFRGGNFQIIIMVKDSRLRFEFPSSQPMPHPGEQVSICFDPSDAIQVFSEKSRR
jgi:ABC-type Fe3+/spermidine/putrescine transport system ATPase subunit